MGIPKKNRAQCTDAPRKGKWMIALIIIVVCFALLTLYILVKQRNVTPFNESSAIKANVTIVNNKDNAMLASSLGKTIGDLPETTGRTGSADNEDSSGFLSVDHNFPGARDWYDYWTYASRKGNVQLNQTHIHDDYVILAVESASNATLHHINEMRRRYESVGALADFYARGLGWIQDRLGLVLTVVIAGNFTTSETANGAENLTLHSGPASIFIVDTIGKMKCGGEEDDWTDRQPPLTMWVRANGSSPRGEIFSGTALPHRLLSTKDNHRCTWRYDFEPYDAAVYSIHVKVLNFNGFVDSLSETCNTEKITSNDQFDSQTHNKSIPGDLTKLEAMNHEVVKELAAEGNYSHHRGLSGFKMYDAIDACCEACARSRNCKMFSIPGALHYDNCELFFDRKETDVDFLDRDSGHYLGRDRNYSYTKQEPSDFPPLRRKLAISPDEIKKPWPVNEHPLKGFPRAGAATYFLGCGWSSMLSFESPCHYPSDDLVFGSGKKVEIVGHPQNNTPGSAEIEVKALRSCDFDDEKLNISNGRWVRYPYPDESVCSAMVRDETSAKFKNFRPLYRGDQPPHCWHRDDLTQIANTCGEVGCTFVVKHRWMTDLKREAEWFGLWQPYECQYHDMGDDAIQQCVDQKQISSIQLKGASISSLVDGYMAQKLQNINMTTAGNGTLSVVIDTLKMPHLLWHLSIDEYKKKLENDFQDVTDDSEYEHYWITGFYFTSEREPHVQLDRSLEYSKMAGDILTPRGYKMINGFDLSAAFGFDTDGQADGLHINGPPIRAIVTKFFHHLCHDVLLSQS